MSPTLRGSLLLPLFLASTTNATVLFTTASDFTNWTSDAGASPSLTFDTDSLSINGQGNLTSPGLPSSPGSLRVQPPGPTGSDAARSPDLANDPTFMSAIDPGWTPGFTVPYSNTLRITYTTPADLSTSQFSFGLNLAYDADGYYDNVAPSLVSDPILLDGLLTRTALFNYTIQPGPLNSFFFRVVYNTSTPSTSPFFIDSIQLPEPTSLLACGFAIPTLLTRRRNR